MNTRMELWKEYRARIEKNKELKNATLNSNIKLKVLYSRFIKAFPEYEKKFKFENTPTNINLDLINDVHEYSTIEFDDILESIEKTEDAFSGSLNEINSLDFSSRELDKVIQKIKKGNIKAKEYIGEKDTNEVKFTPTKAIDLGGPMRKINIAIDGPSGSGKSSAARLVAKKYGFLYINTGLVYRAAALYMIENNIDTSDEKMVLNNLSNVSIELKEDEVVLLNSKDVTKAVRADNVSQNASIISTIAQVRKWALKIQQDKAKNKGVVMDGRDTTFNVLPNAELKIFLDTNPESRAKRRVEQNKFLGFSCDYDVILSEIKERDHRDRTRKNDPLHKTEDAILIDSSNLNLKEVVEKISKLVDKKTK